MAISLRAKLSVLAELREQATDYEADVIGDVAKRLGWLWDCIGDGDFAHWTNVGDANRCERCGRPRPAQPQ